jgi:hypothetical protein
MDATVLLGFLKESLFLIIVLGIFLILAIKKGRQTVTNIILGLYLALLISIEFPFYDVLLSESTSASSEAIIRLLIFIAFAVVSTLLFIRVLPREYDEGSFEGFGRKLLLAIGGTILVMIYSYHVIPVTDYIIPGSPINFLFGSEQTFFWWLLAPIAILFLT